jgi:AcrR family transcriptional regulator
MNPQVRAKPDDTRERIMATAEALFRRLGFAKTAVADIAAELRMSPANIYRFFDSKNAIVEAICQRMERLILEILAYHKENLVTEQRVNELVVAAIEHSWETIRAHKDAMRNVVELVLRDGIDAGDFEPVDPRETAELIMRSVVPFTNPLVVGQCLEEGDDLEAQARASVRFLLRAITPRR